MGTVGHDGRRYLGGVLLRPRILLIPALAMQILSGPMILGVGMAVGGDPPAVFTVLLLTPTIVLGGFAIAAMIGQGWHTAMGWALASVEVVIGAVPLGLSIAYKAWLFMADLYAIPSVIVLLALLWAVTLPRGA